MTGQRFTILTVCTANICRSPLMELLLRAQLDERRFEVASAGVRGWNRQPMDPMAAAELARLGQSADDFVSHPIESYLVDSADLILTATRAHRSDVLSMNPRALRRAFTLMEFAALIQMLDAADPPGLVAQAAQGRSRAPADADIGDPYRRGADAHRRAADQIAAAVNTISVRLNDMVMNAG